MRIRGFTIRQIAELSATECPTGRALSAMTVDRRVNAELTARPQASGAQLRTLELTKLDDLERKVREVLERKHVRIAAGEIVVDDQTGERLVDDAPILAAVRELNRISERRAKLLGIDAPAQIVTDATVRFELIGIQPEDL